MNKIWLNYKHLVKGKLPNQDSLAKENLSHWQNELFYSFLVYCVPFSLVALFPGLFMSFRERYFVIAAVDSFVFLSICVATFSNALSLTSRKILVITSLYFLAICLINFLGYEGPGIFYLFAITVLSSLFFPKGYAYWTIIANLFILLGFTFIINFKLFNSMLINEYSPGSWIAFSSNLIFLSALIVVLVNRIFESLGLTIQHKDQIQTRYRSLFEFSPLPMWLFDTETLRFLDVNEAAIRHYGYTKQEFLSMTIKDIRQSSGASELENLVRENKISGRFYEGKSEHIKKTGEFIYVKIESNLLDLDGRKVRLVLASDITDQLNNELEVFNANLKIKDSEMSLRAIFESTLDGFVLLDAAFNIKIFNAKAKEYIQLNKSFIEFETGKNIFDYVELSRRTYFQGVIDKVYNGEIVEYDRRHRSAEKQIYWIRYTLTPVYEGNKVTGACITGRDITIRKIYLKTVEEQNKVFKEISWIQSHLVRAPLARLMGLTPLLKSANNEQERAEILDYITLSANELDNIIRDITQRSNDNIDKYSHNKSARV